MDTFEKQYFIKYRQFILDKYGIFFSDVKKGLLYSKVCKLMRINEISDFEEYLNILMNPSNPELITEFINEITVNKTEFFRENAHFEFLKNEMPLIMKKNTRIIKNHEIRVWCSACSTGQEPYTIAMILKDLFDSQINLKILATDISSKVIKIAQEGRYPLEIQNEIPPDYLTKYFKKGEREFKATQELKDSVVFRMFNLAEPFPFTKQFDIIFCRNVMIYFDFAMQERLLTKFYQSLCTSGLLFIGHSETLLNKKNAFTYLKPTIYIK